MKVKEKKKDEYSKAEVVDLLQKYIDDNCEGSKSDAARMLKTSKSFITNILSGRDRPPESIFRQLLGDGFELHKEITVTYRRIKN